LNSKRIKTYVLVGLNARPYEIIADLFKNNYGNRKLRMFLTRMEFLVEQMELAWF